MFTMIDKIISNPVLQFIYWWLYQRRHLVPNTNICAYHICFSVTSILCYILLMLIFVIFSHHTSAYTWLIRTSLHFSVKLCRPLIIWSSLCGCNKQTRSFKRYLCMSVAKTRRRDSNWRSNGIRFLISTISSSSINSDLP